MVGSAIWRALQNKGYKNLIGRTSKELDLTNQQKVQDFFQREKVHYVVNAAAKVGGILANSEIPYPFLMTNLQIQNNLIHAAHINNCEKFIFLGSSCIYPKMAPQPLKEEYLLTGSLEETNQWYATAKIAGIKSIEALNKYKNKNFVSLMPTNLYGQNDNYDLNNSHVLPALIRKFHEAKVNNHSEVVLWGSGEPLREFLHVDDLAEAILFSLVNNLDSCLYNVGSGHEISIKELAIMIQQIIGHKGKIIWDKNKPNGTPRKILDSSKLLSIGWNPKVELYEGIKKVYSHLEANQFLFN